jgi:hypothetical protein
MAPAGIRFRVWLRFLAISDLVATGWNQYLGQFIENKEVSGRGAEI